MTLCAVGAVLVYFEYRNELLFFWAGAAAFIVGSILDILDGALARVGGKQSPFGAFLDSPLDRVGEGLMLAAMALVLARDGNVLGSRSRPPRSPARSSSRTRARRPRRSGSGETSGSARARSASS